MWFNVLSTHKITTATAKIVYFAEYVVPHYHSPGSATNFFQLKLIVPVEPFIVLFREKIWSNRKRIEIVYIVFEIQLKRKNTNKKLNKRMKLNFHYGEPLQYKQCWKFSPIRCQLKRPERTLTMKKANKMNINFSTIEKLKREGNKMLHCHL